MNLLLHRFSSQSESTIGALFVTGPERRQFQCFTLEDEYREVKVPKETRIPSGTYRITLRTEGGMHKQYAAKYTWHAGMLHLLDVPGFEWIYIHPGNTDQNTEGCILVGDGATSNVTTRGSIQSSVPAYERLYRKILDALRAGELVQIQVVDYA